LAAALALGTVAGCGSDPDPVAPPASEILAHDDLLVSIPREIDEDNDFYLAVRKSALDDRWFWSVYLKDLQPFGPLPITLGTKVVRFREQNDKLYVFDADDRRATSDVFSPELIIDAFPIVHSDHFHSLPGSGGYVLFDPAAGQNRFDALSDFFGSDPGPIKFAVELAFVQAFRPASDGGSFEQIVTGYTDVAIGGPGNIDPNDFRATATLGVSLRRYFETPSYHRVAAPPKSFYFLGEPANIPNTGERVQVAEHWGIAPGMTPIKWLIGPEINKIAANPAFGGANLFEAMKRGIESWNAVFGFPVVTAALAGPDDSFADDHVNYLIVDPDVSGDIAFADSRKNPNTGEIRGASIYFGGGVFQPFADDDAAVAPLLATPEPPALPAVPSLVWQDQKDDPLCVLWGPRAQADLRAVVDQASLTGAQKQEAFLQEVTAHEIGHTLGLRHNFKGSLVPPTSSVMEYSLLSVRIAQPTPAVYDQQAIHYLYGQSPDLPTAPFCTDEDLAVDPNCIQADGPSPTPLVDFQIPRYRGVIGQLLGGALPPAFTSFFLSIAGTELYGYARAGTPAEAAAAWQAALDGVRAPLTAAQAGNPIYAAAADALSAFVYRALYVQQAGVIRRAISDPTVVAAVASDGKNIVENLDGVRSYPTRRLVVDALKNAQKLDAYLALLDARTALAAQLGGLGPSDQALTRGLIARIDVATTPYFR
jgi:hypothetical protein